MGSKEIAAVISVSMRGDTSIGINSNFPMFSGEEVWLEARARGCVSEGVALETMKRLLQIHPVFRILTHLNWEHP